MGLLLFVAPEEEEGPGGGAPLAEHCCCSHGWCAPSRARAWCGHWYKITWMFRNWAAGLRTAFEAVGAALTQGGLRYDYRCDRDTMPEQGVRIVTWLYCCRADGTAVSLDCVDGLLRWPHVMGRRCRGIRERCRVERFSCCVLRLATLEEAGMPLGDRLYGRQQPFETEFFGSLLRRTYADGEVVAALDGRSDLLSREDELG